MPLPEIKRQLDNFRKKTNYFISYQRDDTKLAKAIVNRLKKYEFNVWIDFSYIRAGVNFQEEIKNALLKAVNNGYVITLLNERILNLKGRTRAEFIMALRKGDHPERSIISIIQNHTLWDIIREDNKFQILHNINAIDS